MKGKFSHMSICIHIKTHCLQEYYDAIIPVRSVFKTLPYILFLEGSVSASQILYNVM